MSVVTDLSHRLKIIEFDFHWFMKSGNIPPNYSGSWLPMWGNSTNVEYWYNSTFSIFINYEELLLEETVDAL